MTDTLTKLCAKLEALACWHDRRAFAAEKHSVIYANATGAATTLREALALLRAQSEALAVAREGLGVLEAKLLDANRYRATGDRNLNASVFQVVKNLALKCADDARATLARIDALTGKDA